MRKMLYLCGIKFKKRLYNYCVYVAGCTVVFSIAVMQY